MYVWNANSVHGKNIKIKYAGTSVRIRKFNRSSFTEILCIFFFFVVFFYRFSITFCRLDMCKSVFNVGLRQIFLLLLTSHNRQKYEV